MDRLNIHDGKSPTTYSAILLDRKYDYIRTEAMNAGILLKEIDENVEEIIHDGNIIQSHAQDVRTNAGRFYRNLMQSEKLVRYCQWIFVVVVITLVIIFIGKVFIGKRN